MNLPQLENRITSAVEQLSSSVMSITSHRFSRPRDMIAHVNEKTISQTRDLLSIGTTLPLGSKVKFSLRRGSATLEVGLKLEEAPEEFAFLLRRGRSFRPAFMGT